MGGKQGRKWLSWFVTVWRQVVNIYWHDGLHAYIGWCLVTCLLLCFSLGGIILLAKNDAAWQSAQAPKEIPLHIELTATSNNSYTSSSEDATLPAYVAIAIHEPLTEPLTAPESPLPKLPQTGQGFAWYQYGIIVLLCAVLCTALSLPLLRLHQRHYDETPTDPELAWSYIRLSCGSSM